MFSVVIPLYNKAHTIQNTIQTVLNQTYKDFEVIIVDDGSTDNGVAVIQKCVQDIRIRIISQHNQGVSVARNTGIKEAKHPWISFLDGDDEWLPEYLETVYQAIVKYPETGMVLTGRFSQNVLKGERINSTPEQYKNRTTLIEFFHNPHVFAHISATTVNRTFLIDNIKGWGGFVPGQKSNEDFLFLFRVALHTRVVFCGFPLAIYNGGVVGQTTSVLDEQKKLADSILFHNLVLKEWLLMNKHNESFKIFMKYEVRHIIYIHLKSKNYKEISAFLNGLDVGYSLDLFSKIELLLWQKASINKFILLLIGASKVRWRLRGYPVVKN